MIRSTLANCLEATRSKHRVDAIGAATLCVASSFLWNRELSDISTSARERMQSEFEAIRPTLYQSFLEKEAERLNCDVSEVRPIVPILPVQEDGGQSDLCSLPADVLAKIMARLETVEIFQMSQVCKKWRQLVCSNACMPRRAEHSLTTHLLTFTNWMDPSKAVNGEDFIEHHQSFGWGLMKWCINISQNLETLALHELDCLYGEAMHLVSQCPNLKHLHLKFSDKGRGIGTYISLPKLETLIIRDSPFCNSSTLVLSAFTTSNNLRVFRGKLDAEEVICIDETRLNQDAFSSLIALQLTSISTGLFGALASIDQLQLRYLHLGDLFAQDRHEMHSFQQRINKERDAFHRLLSKQNQLEVLVVLYGLKLNENAIQLMTETQRNLKSAVIQLDETSLHYGGGLAPTVGRDHTDVKAALVSFERMLLEKDPSIDLSAFQFIVNNARSRLLLRDANIRFSIYPKRQLGIGLFGKWDLSHPAMRKRLGIDF